MHGRHVDEHTIHPTILVPADASPFMPEPLAVFRQPHLLEHGDPGVGIASEADTPPAIEDVSHIGDPVAKIGFGQRTQAHPRARFEISGHVVVMRMRVMNGGEAIIELKAIQQNAGRGCTVCIHAVCDLRTLFLDAHVEHKPETGFLMKRARASLGTARMECPTTPSCCMQPSMLEANRSMLFQRIEGCAIETPLCWLERSTEAAAHVVGVQENDADADLAGRLEATSSNTQSPGLS